MAAHDTGPDIAAFRQLVDERLRTMVDRPDPPGLYDGVRYVLSAPGKRIRPTFLWLSASVFGAPDERVIESALAVEVFHNFTLVHDDIMDNASERRGRATVHVRWGEPAAILVGDYLFALAYRLLINASGRTDVHRIMTTFDEMVAALCEGQMLDESLSGGKLSGLDTYLRMIDGKTGALLRACLIIGAIQAGADDDSVNKLADIGTFLGRAFQIQDDLLDVVSDDQRWGKRRGGDLIEGKQTFLILRALEIASGADHEYLGNLIEQRGVAQEDVDDAITTLHRVGAVEEASREVTRYTEQACALLSTLPEVAARRVLERLVRSLGARTH